MIRVLSLFAGIGGIDLGLHWSGGFQTVGWCEREPFCRRVLEHHWPGLWNHDDITTLDPGDAVRGCGGIDLVCGGAPCQPVSTAGKRRGADDARWLWPDMARVIRGVRPRWVLAENVPGLRSLGADAVLDDLEAAGYACWPVVVGAGHAGAAHKRQRVFVVANDASVRFRQGRQPEAQAARRFQGCDSGKLVADSSGWRSPQETKPTRQGRRTLIDTRVTRFPVPVECDQESWEPPRLVYQPRLCGSVDGLSVRMDRLARRSRRDRIKALGNAVVPQVAYVIGRAIMRMDQQT